MCESAKSIISTPHHGVQAVASGRQHLSLAKGQLMAYVIFGTP